MSKSAPSGPILNQLIGDVARQTSHVSTERRRSVRHRVTIEVRAQPLDDTFTPVGDPFTAITRDISAAGIGLLHTRAIKEKYLQLQVGTSQGDITCVILEVLRCRPIGPFYEIGGRFVVDVDPTQ